jgi:BetI-type transcriptional repressor, C-terminal
MGELVALEQIKNDAEQLETELIPIGPFARLDANLVAARDGKTRGAITNTFGSQAAFQVETMALALSARDWIERIEYPSPADFPSAEAWVDALLAGESDRGPRHGEEPTVSYASLWALWLSTLPYGLWSEQIAAASMTEYRQWLDRLAWVLEEALEHFDLSLREGTTIQDLASALASLIEGTWLNQCLTTRHPLERSEPIATALVRGGRLLWQGATQPRPAAAPT